MRNSNRPDRDAAPLDAVALSLALWLAAMVGVTGVSRLHLPLDYGASVGATTADSHRMALAFGGQG